MSTILMTGKTGTTLKHTAGDTAETLSDVSNWAGQVSGKNCIGVLLTVEDNGIRFAWGANPTQDGGTAVGHVLAAGSSLKLSNHKQIIDFRFINKVNSSNAVLQITPEYNIP